MNEIEQELISKDLDDEGHNLLKNKLLVLINLFLIIQHIGQSTPRAKLKYAAWINRGRNRVEMAELLETSIDGLRATIWYFNNRIENIIGKETVNNILRCKSMYKLKEIETELEKRINSVSKGYFR